MVEAAECCLKVLQSDHAIFTGCFKSSKTSETSRDKEKNKSPQLRTRTVSAIVHLWVYVYRHTSDKTLGFLILILDS